jgi:predicted MPP superfamily phosphohydrolase
MKLIHLSDIHIGSSSNYRKFQVIVKWLVKSKTSLGASTIIVTGDIVDDGALWQYRLARNLLRQLREAGYLVLCCPGNHDYGLSGIIESRKGLKYFNHYISPGINYPHCEIVDNHAIILLDSMAGEVEELEFWGAQGKLGDDQLRNLDQLLNDAPKSKVILALHHHPFYYSYFLKLRDDKLFKSVIDGRVDCILFGHKHVEQRLYPSMDIGMVHAAGSVVERGEDGALMMDLIDLDVNSVEHYKVAQTAAGGAKPADGSKPASGLANES